MSQHRIFYSIFIYNLSMMCLIMSSVSLCMLYILRSNDIFAYSNGTDMNHSFIHFFNLIISQSLTYFKRMKNPKIDTILDKLFFQNTHLIKKVYVKIYCIEKLNLFSLVIAIKEIKSKQIELKKNCGIHAN
ncbi:hypothetical protein BpHYR1_044650 [Brachionus plicatilis]|uniref:Uncharacterized protein n=1 Tax=Brachionus plicatilis TaxID=10195 RepID=A0A3M7T6V3_BRAPC|nr:hypothetical protein BpHYR1_044650 [Brachionus plicatilis]